jgi:pimeloyl-ACP methyl ester carboxylesterase
MLVKIADLSVNYDVAGIGRTIVLLHGAGADLIAWDEIVPRLSNQFRVWRTDQRGFGRTVRPPLPRLSLEVWTSDLLAFMGAKGIHQAAIVGWSMGGAVALNFAALHPDRVTHLIPIGAPGPQRVVSDKSGFEVRQHMAEAGASVREIVDATFDFTRSAFSRWSREHNSTAVEKMRQTLLRNDTRDYAEMVDALDGLCEFGPRLARITAPTLLICGAEDSRTPPEMSVENHAAIQDSRLEIISDCGHFPVFEKPTEIARLISDFVAQ